MQGIFLLPANCGKVMFLHASVVLFTGRLLCTPRPRMPPPCHAHPPPHHHHHDMVNEQAVRILLECILVTNKIVRSQVLRESHLKTHYTSTKGEVFWACYTGHVWHNILVCCFVEQIWWCRWLTQQCFLSLTLHIIFVFFSSCPYHESTV